MGAQWEKAYANYKRYLCKDPCGNGDVLVTTNSASWDRWSMKGISGSSAVRLTLRNVQPFEAGVYWRAVERQGTDVYQKLTLTVVKPMAPQLSAVIPRVRSDGQGNLETVAEDATPREVSHHIVAQQYPEVGKEGAGRVLHKCGDNTTCALALLHYQDLGLGDDCWICHPMMARLTVTPLTYKSVFEENANKTWGNGEGQCVISKDMLSLVYMVGGLRNGVVKNNIKLNCTNGSGVPNSRVYKVPRVGTEVCVCANSSATRAPTVGYSDCQNRIAVNPANGSSCSVSVNGTMRTLECLFSRALLSTPSVMWVCGKAAFHNLPREFRWKGCCAPTVVSVGTSVYHLAEEMQPGSQAGQLRRSARSTSTQEGIPRKYRGYILGDPWTTPGKKAKVHKT
ncbi:hypothetical protein AAFF_G00223110 [Aldrovandia affinis]|uniref:Uncharacterized protein n=1 Tax=Aldrovandia affinis TaxID=143900 RepID=A0AAD7RI75_9TELE|nr:hypothetical protein AAFF_G00223110 [Aldrovandia affinis]